MTDQNFIARGMVNEIAPDVWYLPVVMANVYFVGRRGGPWVLIDAGLRGTAWRIKQAAEECFGPGARPEAIVLTHGHFDHVGALDALMRDWHVPVYAHHLEMPYLTGRSDYPPPDPTVGGFMAQLSRMFPHTAYNFAGIQEFSSDGAFSFLPGWRWIHTPGHTVGHVSLFRESDRTLIAGDAVITVNQDNPALLMTQARQLRRPPAYLTQDWNAAAESVRRLAALRPQTIATGHGLPMSGADVADKLQHLANHFHAPKQGRYVAEPVRTDASGAVVYVPPPSAPDPWPKYVAGLAVGALVATAFAARSRRKRSRV